MAAIFFCFPIVPTIGKTNFLYKKQSRLAKKLYFPMVFTIRKQTKMAAIFSTIGKPNTIGNRTDPYHSNFKCVRYSSPHRRGQRKFCFLVKVKDQMALGGKGKSLKWQYF